MPSFLAITTLQASAYDFEVDGIYYNILQNETSVEVTTLYYYAGDVAGDVVIPERVTYNGNTYDVTSIGESAFYNCSNLKSIEIPNSVTEIGNSAFKYCSSLTSVEIPNSVTEIGDSAFYFCTSMISIEIPNSITSICKSVFSDCESLTSVVIPNSVTEIGVDAFAYCTNLASIEIPKSVISIGNGAFCRCSSLTSIEIPNSVTSIGTVAFGDCSSLEEIHVEDGNPMYKSYEGILYNKSMTELIQCPGGLTEVRVPDSVTSIGPGAFYNCRSLTSIEILNSVTFIDFGAFYLCSSLTSIEIPNSVTSIGEHAFGHCNSLTSAVIGNSVTSIGSSAFRDCLSLTSIQIPNSVISIGDWAFGNCYSLTYIEVPNSVTSIERGLFCNCTGLTSIKISNSVTSIGERAFESCSSLTEITVLNPIPPTADSSSFSGLYYNAILYVPKEAIEAYKSTAPWSQFKNIEAIKTNSVESIVLNPLTFFVGESVRMSADVLPEEATDKTIGWSSDAPEVAAVDADGKVWFNGVGEATVTAECQGHTAAMTFRVEAVEAEELNVFPAEAVGPVGQSFYMLALHTPDNTTDKSVSWESSDPTVATVDEDGRIELLAQGQTTVTATSGAHTATATITVSGNTTDLIELSGNGVAIKVSDGGIDVLNAPEMACVIVSGVDGRVVTAMYAETPELHIPLAPGIYLVKVGDTATAKVLVK